MADEDLTLSPSEAKNPLYLLTQNESTSDTSTDDIVSRIFIQQNFPVVVSQERTQDTSKTLKSEAGLSDGTATSPTVHSTDSYARLPKKEIRTQQICPVVNCQEKIVLCLDLSLDLFLPSFRTRAGDKFTPLQLIKRALSFFMWGKKSIGSTHMFALVILKEQAFWAHDFTENPLEILQFLSEINLEDPNESHSYDVCDLSTIFEVIHDKVELPHLSRPQEEKPPFLVRVLLIYGRNHCIPDFGDKEMQNILNASPHFFVDAFYVHEPPSHDNKCEEIFNKLCELDDKGFSYIYEVSRNPTKLYDNMAKLLAHPLQRAIWTDTHYNIEPSEEQMPEGVPTLFTNQSCSASTSS